VARQEAGTCVREDSPHHSPESAWNRTHFTVPINSCFKILLLAMSGCRQLHGSAAAAVRPLPPPSRSCHYNTCWRTARMNSSTSLTQRQMALHSITILCCRRSFVSGEVSWPSLQVSPCAPMARGGGQPGKPSKTVREGACKAAAVMARSDHQRWLRKATQPDRHTAWRQPATQTPDAQPAAASSHVPHTCTTNPLLPFSRRFGHLFMCGQASKVEAMFFCGGDMR
jgi:hypothetical protein